MTDLAANQIALPPVVDLDALDAVHDQLQSALEAGPVAISVASVERVSTNALFMLLSAAETARRVGHAFSISDTSEPLLNAASRLGLSRQLADLMEG